jgi:carboxymethylenebutenolidase
MEEVELSVADGTRMNAYVARPEPGTSNGAAILVFQEAFGVNRHIRSVAERFAGLGYIAVAPELFHRTAPKGFSAPYGDFEVLRPHMSALTEEHLAADAAAAYAWAASQKEIGPDRVACVGFCMGGRVSFIANSSVPLRAGISFYGGGIAPNLLSCANRDSGPMLMFWGGKDQHIGPDQYRAVADALNAAGAAHEQVIFSQADHGFFCDERASYDAGAARQAWALLTEFLDVLLPRAQAAI